MKMSIILLICGVAVCIRAATLNDVNGEVKDLMVPELPEEQSTKEKRTLGVDRSYKKEYEIKTKSGASIKVSKERKYNDGGAITLLPSLLDAITKNRIRIMNARNMRKACRSYGYCKNIGDTEIDTVDQTGYDNQVNFGDVENIDGQTGGSGQTGGNGQISGDILGGETNGKTQIPIGNGASTGQLGSGVQIGGGSASIGTGIVIVQPLQPVNQHWILRGQQDQVIGARQGFGVSGGYYDSQYRRHYGHHGHRGPLGAEVQVGRGAQVVDAGYSGLWAHKKARLERKLANKIAKL